MVDAAIPLNLIELAETGSTNDDAKQLAREGCPEGTVVWAHRQNAGRGRQGNQWVTIDGNLFMSLVLRPGKTAPETGQLSFVAAVALAEALGDVLPCEAALTLKWPNDVLLGGKKAAGILLEAESASNGGVDWVVIGMGLNVMGAPEGAVSLAGLGVKTTARDMLEKVYQRLISLYGIWQQRGFAPIRAEWLRHAGNIGNVINIRLPRETFSATFVGIDDNGALQVVLSDGTRRDIASGEVFAA